jgi:hypothetical protein
MKKENLQKLSRGVLATMLAVIVFSCQEPDLKTDVDVKSSEAKAAGIEADHYELAKRWGPIHYMDVDATGTYAEGGKSDYISAMNYDGDWNGLNNWNNVSNAPLAATVYYSVTETATHWFITYAFFHPRDWTDVALLYYLDQHENDFEGVLVAVEKDGSQFGVLRGAVTTEHKDFYAYIPSGSSYTNGLEDIDGTLEMVSYNGVLHPVTAQDVQGHGLKAWPQHNINGDGIIYYPSANWDAQVPADNYDNYVEYRLVDVFESGGMWAQRFNTAMFSSPGGGIVGDDFITGGANAPWAWDDGNDAIVQSGEIATDPAKLIENYFDGVGNFSRTYTYNVYNATAGGVATVYQNCNYTGYALALPVGDYTLDRLKSYGVVNDDLSSVRVASGYKITLYEHDNFGGQSVLVTGDNSCLGNFNDKASSIKISVQ